MERSYEGYKSSADYIRARIKETPKMAIILGSGLGDYADRLTDTTVIPYREIPNFPVSTVWYQKGELVFGYIEGVPVLAMNGRFHYYEGYEMWQAAYPVGVFKLLGIEKLIVTNASGGICPDYRPGDLVCVYDHIKLCADSPLRGHNIPEFGARFFDMQSVYDKELRTIAHQAAEELGMTLHDGIYAFMGGPQYETPAEIRMLSKMGATLVGMSTVPEIIFAAQCGIRVLCISCATNMAAGVTGAVIDEDEVVEMGKQISSRFQALVTKVITASC